MTTHSEDLGQFREVTAQMAPVERVNLLIALVRDAAEIRKNLRSVEGRINQVRGALLEYLSQSGNDHINAPFGSVSLKWVSNGTVVDLQAFHAYILLTGELDLLENRPSQAAIRERWEAGDEVPGVVREDKQTLTISQSKGSTP